MISNITQKHKLSLLAVFCFTLYVLLVPTGFVHSAIIEDELGDIATIDTQYGINGNQILFVETNNDYSLARIYRYIKLLNAPSTGTFYLQLKYNSGANSQDCRSQNINESDLSNSTYSLTSFDFSGTECAILPVRSNYELYVLTDTTFTNTALNGGLSTNGYPYNRVYDTSDGGEDCSTCTRIVLFSPTSGQLLSGTSTAQAISIDYYVNSSDYIVGKTYFEYTINHTLYNSQLINAYTATRQTATTSVLITDEETTYIDLYKYMYFNGTYNFNARIYTIDIEEDSWWNPFDKDVITRTPLASDSSIFYVATTTSLSEMEYQQGIDIINNANIDDGDTQLWELSVNSALEKIKYTPPIGYGTRIYEIFTATSTGSTTSLDIVYTYPAGTPGEGLTIALPLSTGIIDALDNMEVISPGIFETFMFYWNTLWYIILGIWILKMIFNVTGVSFEVDMPERETTTTTIGFGRKNYQRSGNVKGTSLVRPTRSKAKEGSTFIKVKKG